MTALEQALKIERAQNIPIGKAGKKVEVTGFPGTVGLRKSARRYSFIAVHKKVVNYNVKHDDIRAHMTFHSRRDLCKPVSWGVEPDQVLKVIEIN